MKIAAFPAFKKKDNPFQVLLYKSIAELGNDVYEFNLKSVFFKKADIVHIHWPESNKFKKGAIVGALYFLYFNFLVLSSKVGGAKVIWTVHNLEPHDSNLSRLVRAHFFIFTLLVDGYILMNKSSSQRVIDQYPNLRSKKKAYIPHGHYKGFYKENVSHDHARKYCGTHKNQFVFMLLGNLREYKGLDHLLESFVQTKNANFRLLVVGKLSGSNLFKEKLKKLMTSDSRVSFYEGFVHDDKLQYYFRAADLVVLPYKDLFNSGAKLLSLSFATPVALLSSPIANAYQKEFGSKWVKLLDDISVDKFEMMSNLEIPEGDQEPDLSSRSWDVIADSTMSFFRLVVKGSKNE